HRARGLVVVRLCAEDPYGMRGRPRRGRDAGHRAACIRDIPCLATAGPAAGECGAGADELDGVVEPAGVNVPDRAHDRSVEPEADLVERGVSAVGVPGVGRVGERAVLAVTALAVEDGVALASADVEPDRDDRLDGTRKRRAWRDEIEVPDEADARRGGQLVVDHLVERPAIARLVRIAVSA